jgi:Fic family protein
MDPTDFAPNMPGRLVAIAGGATAFVPDPLPPALVPDTALWKAESDAVRAIAKLEVVLPSAGLDPFLVTYALIDREAFYTSRMEGTFTTPESLVLFDLDKADDSRLGESTKEVVNYRRAVTNCVGEVSASGAITHGLIRGAHKTLLSGVRGGEKHPGEYRRSQNHIGRSGDIRAARFVPPPPLEMRSGMDDLIAFMATSMKPESPLPALAALALAHYQFEALHPFEDGNGRVGRMLIPLLLIANQQMKEPLLHVSATVEKHRDVYSDLLLAVSRRGAWNEWIHFFLRILTEAAGDTMRLVGRLLELRESFHARIVRPKRSVALHRFVDSLFEHPGTTIRRASEIMGVQFAQASEHVQALVDLGILVETTGKPKNRRYVAPAVLEMVFRTP